MFVVRAKIFYFSLFMKRSITGTVFQSLFIWCVISDDELKDDLAGSTANIVLIKDNKIYCVRCFHLIFAVWCL